jgi:hypothetical protein
VKVHTKKHSKQIIFTAEKLKRSIKLTVIPTKKNDYRPHLVRRYGLLAVFVIVVGIQLTYNGINSSQILGKESEITISSLLSQTNSARSGKRGALKT